ncbi:DNA polymerase III subunit gamma/tau ['Fragaria x ananassa' phyllody phytoplasma]|uniref:DNA polymerase III subunit gamma/tau n=1 Tax='Fragaria x ananassa' phyllody phytoplasma TaxID=2358428 RepID=UPI00280B6EAB|nr:DNA polymerase III subunit gamma/tau ['Fragaria x ananassa' phyllody phytoplasma]
MSYLVLYRKYRPQTFKDVVGQKIIIQILKNTIRYQKINHCYLFSGNKGTGKTTLAKIFAKAINCFQPQAGDVCNQCQSCQNNMTTNTDVFEIDGASYNGVDEIREIHDKIQYKAHVGKYKIYVIDEVHVLTSNAFNALLKILEEPPQHVIFILITTEIYKIPETILSRAQSFSFENLSSKDIIGQLQKVTHLEKIVITDDACKTIANYAEGSMRNALSLLDQISSYQNNLITSEDVLEVKGLVSGTFLKNLLQSLMDKQPHKALQLLEQACDAGKNLELLIIDLITSCKDYLFLRLADVNQVTFKNTNTKNTMTNQPLSLNYDAFHHIDVIVKTLIKLQQDLKKSVQKKVFVEIAFLQICMIDHKISKKETLTSLNPVSSPLDDSQKFPSTKTIHSAQAKPLTKLLLKDNSTNPYLLEKPPLNFANKTQFLKQTLTPDYDIFSIKNLLMTVYNILLQDNQSQKQMIVNFWDKLQNHYQHSFKKTTATLLYKGKLVALSQTKEMILVYQDKIACQQMLKKTMKVNVLNLLNAKSELIKNYVCLLEEDWQSLMTFLQNNANKSIDVFLTNCNWDINFYKTKAASSIKMPFIVQLAYDFFGKNMVEIIN